MNKKILLFSQKENSYDISLVHEKIKNFKPVLVLCNNEYVFKKSYDCNVDLIIYYDENAYELKNIINKYPKDTKFNIVNFKDFMSTNFSLNNFDKTVLTNKFLMSHFLEKINIYSTKIQEIIIKRILVNAVNLNLSRISSSLLYFTISDLNLDVKKIIPDIRDFLKHWGNNCIIDNITNTSKKSFRINTILTKILNEYKKYASGFPNNKDVFTVFENAFYLEKYYKNNIELTKTIKTIIIKANKNL